MTTAMIDLHPKVREFISKPRKMLIDGKWVEAASGKSFATYNPATGEKLTTVPEGEKEDIDRAVIAARRAFEEGPWPKMLPTDREKLLLDIADLIEKNAEELAHLESLDNGMPVKISHGLALKMAKVFRYYAGWATKITGETNPVSAPGEFFNYTRREPVGVVGQITQWNGPLVGFYMKVPVALATGNTVVIKPAELTPLSALRMGELLQEAGVPDGVLNIVTGYGPVAGAALSEHMDVDKVAFTGSIATGKTIMEAAARTNLKRVTLELGGKSANIVFADADYDRALRLAAEGVFTLTGQMCHAGSRLFIEESIYDRFVSDLSEIGKQIKIGNGFHPETDIGPVISQNQKDRILTYLNSGVEQGAELVIGGDANEAQYEQGHYVKPSILANVTSEMKVFQEEIFGPVISAIPFNEMDELIKQANNSIYGLAGGVHTSDVRKAHKVAHAMRTGTVWVNTYGLLDAATPYGGYKQSGIGNEFGKESIDAYTEVKSIWIDLND